MDYARLAMTEKVRSISTRHRDVADSSKLTTIDNAIKSSCMDATMCMLRQLHELSDKETYVYVARYMMTVAFACPLKLICVGISPYENGILPPYASGLSYSPMKCLGCTPSVQGMSQLMSPVAVNVKRSHVRKTKFGTE